MQTTVKLQPIVTELANAIADQRWSDVLGHLSADAVAHVPGVGDLAGVDAIATFLLETAAKTDDGEHFEVLDVLAGERFSAMYLRVTATRAGRPPLDNLTVYVARIEDDKVAEIWFHNHDGQAVADFWA